MKEIATVMALLGGFVLTCLIVVTCVSICGRILNTIGHSDFVSTFILFAAPFLQSFGPLVGDFELVEAGIAFSIMAFIPLCQLSRSHAVVEIGSNFFPPVVRRFLTCLWECVFAFAFVIIAWRLYVGTTDKMRYGETTFMLQFPIWWGYAVCTFAAIVACIVAVYSAGLHLKDIDGLENDYEVAS